MFTHMTIFQGNYGIVFKAILKCNEYEQMEVAVKTLKRRCIIYDFSLTLSQRNWCG